MIRGTQLVFLQVGKLVAYKTSPSVQVHVLVSNIYANSGSTICLWIRKDFDF